MRSTRSNMVRAAVAASYKVAVPTPYHGGPTDTGWGADMRALPEAGNEAPRLDVPIPLMSRAKG